MSQIIPISSPLAIDSFGVHIVVNTGRKLPPLGTEEVVKDAFASIDRRCWDYSQYRLGGLSGKITNFNNYLPIAVSVGYNQTIGEVGGKTLFGGWKDEKMHRCCSFDLCECVSH